MRIFLKSLSVIVIILVLLVVAASQLISPQDIIEQVSSQVEQTTGRTFTVNDEANLKVFPSLLIELHDVRFANIEDGSRSDMARISELVIHIPWLSLFSGELTIDKFVINNPDILLEKRVDGIVNWQFLPLTSTNEEIKNTANNAVANNTVMTLPEAFDVSLGQVEINGGKLTIIDHQSKDTKMIDQLNLAVMLPSLREDLNLSGNIRYMEHVFELESTVTTPAKAINNQPFSINLSLTSKLATLNYEGKVLRQGKELNGMLSLSGDSVKQLLRWQKLPLEAKDEAFNQFSLTTQVHFVGSKLSLDELQMKLDALAFNGSTTIDLTTPLNITSTIDLGILNLNPYLPAETTVASQKKQTDSQPLVWDNTALDLSALAALNAELSIQSSQLFAREVKLGKNAIKVTLQNGIANIALKSFQGYEGNGSGSIKVNANKKPYIINSQFQLTNINAEPLLTDAIGFDKLMGKGQLAWELTTQGLSQRDFIDALDGSIDFSFIDGAIKGVNLAAIAKSASNIVAGNLAAVNLDSNFSNAEKTDFAELTGKFELNKGIATTNNLSLKNPFVRISGMGDINLPKTKVKLQVKTTMVSSAKGQAAQGDSAGIDIPIKIKGPFHDIKIRPDISSATKDKVKDKIKDKVKNKLKGLFG